MQCGVMVLTNGGVDGGSEHLPRVMPLRSLGFSVYGSGTTRLQPTSLWLRIASSSSSHTVLQMLDGCMCSLLWMATCAPGSMSASVLPTAPNTMAS